MKSFFLVACLATSVVANGQIRNNDVYEFGGQINTSNVRHEVRIPMVDGLLPLKCDLHAHTIFSDGAVLPSVRVTEAWHQGLDVIAMTDHIEYRPHIDILKGDLNESNKLAQKAAENRGIIVINGIEITRKKPLGHLNALFINDANPMDIEDPLMAIDIALEQGAFILWNHPGWPDDESKIYPVHKELIKEGKIHGIEVFNEAEYYPKSFDWCNDYNLAYISNSDIHGLTSIVYGAGANVIRPMTIVFAKEKTTESLKEALFARRTLAYFNGELAGDKELMAKLVKASLKMTNVGGDKIEVYNDSDISYSISGNDKTYLFPASKVVLMTQPKEGDFVVNNCHVGQDAKLKLTAEQLFK